MKILLLALPFVFLSCGKVDLPKTNLEALGSVRPLSETRSLTTVEISRLTSICQAAARKNSNLTSQLPVGDIVFTVNETDCSGDFLSRNLDVPVRVKLENFTNFVFEKTNPLSKDYPFPKVETPTDGILAGICQNLQALKSPIVKPTGEAIYVSSVDNADCTSTVNETCMTIETANQFQDSYTVHTTETLKFRSNDTEFNLPIYGYYTQRIRRTSLGCAAGSSKSVTSVMKSFP
jgi:hypothetical protein